MGAVTQLEGALRYFQQLAARRSVLVQPDLRWMLVVERNRRLWLAGDVFFVGIPTGAGRQPCTGISSKGRRLKDYWITNVPYSNQGGFIVTAPCDLVTMSPDDTAPLRRAIVGAYAQAIAAGRVGACIPPAFLGDA